MNRYDQLPDWAQQEIKQLRAECAKFRTRAKQHQAAQRQLDAVKAIIALEDTHR